MTSNRLTIAIVAGLTLAAGAASAQAPDPAHGKSLFYANGCYGCHGFQGQTGARNLVGTNSPILATPEGFLAFLRGRGAFQPMIPSTRMPSFPKTAIADPQALDIYAYIKTFTLDAPEVKDIPTFTAIQASASAPYKPGR